MQFGNITHPHFEIGIFKLVSNIHLVKEVPYNSHKAGVKQNFHRSISGTSFRNRNFHTTIYRFVKQVHKS